MPKILIEESALDSIKRMAQEVQDQRDELLAACELFISYENACDSGDDISMMFAYKTAQDAIRAAIARCQESTKVFE